MQNLEKVVKSLVLVNTDTRNETIQSLIESVLYELDELITFEELNEFIKTSFSIEVHPRELQAELDTLSLQTFLEKGNGGRFKLNYERRIALRSLFLKEEESKKRRYENFKGILLKIVGAKNIEEDILKKYWDVFTEYLYDTFFQYGREAIKIFFPEANSNSTGEDSLTKKYFEKFSHQDERDLFKKLLEQFPIFLNADDLEYLEKLARKTESFYSLGLSIDEYNEMKKVDFLEGLTIYVDTNFLYSILNLHKNPETQACHEIIEWNKRNKHLFKFRYTHRTLQELSHKRDDLDRSIPKENFTRSQIQALVESGKLDSFSQSYYERKIIDPQNTPRPADVILRAQNILKSKGIEISNSKFEKISESEEYLKDRESQYRTFINMTNEVRSEKGLDQRLRDVPEIEHDIFLREVIEQLRKGIKQTSIHEVKYLGLTLDKLLIRFDKNNLRKRNTGIIIPNFFSPTYFLGCLIKLSPVETDDYKRAFIAAISSQTFFSKSYSRAVQYSVKYFYQMGIDNEQLILEMLQNDVFLKELDGIESEEQKGNFVLSEIGNKVNALQGETKLKTAELDLYRQRESEQESRFAELSNEKQAAENKYRQFKEMYDFILSNLNKKKSIEESLTKVSVIQIPFENAEELKKLESENQLLKQTNQGLKTHLKKEFVKREILWMRIWGFFSLIPALLILLSVILIFGWITSSFNYMTLLISFLERQYDEVRIRLITEIFFPIISGGLEFLLIKSFYNRICNKGKISEVKLKLENEFDSK